MVIIINFLIGLLTGIACILPGISASAILMIFNKYNEIIDNIINFNKNKKKNTLYLLPLFIGIIIGIYIFSNILEFALIKYSLSLSIIFIFLIINTLPKCINNIKANKINILFFIIPFILGTILLNITYKINLPQNTFFIIFMGIILSITTIIPGLSTTIMFNMFGFYNTYLHSINTLNIKVLIPLIISFILTSLILIKIINKLFKKYYDKTYLSILGFTISTIPSLILNKITINLEFFIAVAIGIIITIIINKYKKRLN